MVSNKLITPPIALSCGQSAAKLATQACGGGASEPPAGEYLLLEDGTELLLEDGTQLELESN